MCPAARMTTGHRPVATIGSALAVLCVALGAVFALVATPAIADATTGSPVPVTDTGNPVPVTGESTDVPPETSDTTTVPEVSTPDTTVETSTPEPTASTPTTTPAPRTTRVPRTDEVVPLPTRTTTAPSSRSRTVGAEPVSQNVMQASANRPTSNTPLIVVAIASLLGATALLVYLGIGLLRGRR